MNCTFFGGETYTIWIENSADTLQMYNCILAGGQNIGLAFEKKGVGNYQGDYNLFQNDNASRAVAVAYEDEFSLDQLKNRVWTQYSKKDIHSVVVNSVSNLFVKATQYDFRLQEISLAVDQGTNVGAPSEDFNGDARPSGQGYDIGAFELQFSARK